MDDIGEFKTFLGALAEAYNEAELRQLQYEMHAMAELLLDIYLENNAKRHLGEPVDSPKLES